MQNKLLLQGRYIILLYYIMYSPYQRHIVLLDSLTPTRRTEGAFSQQAVDMDKAAMTSLFFGCHCQVKC